MIFGYPEMNLQSKLKASALKKIKVCASRLVDLPWNSPWTWILTAVLVDLGYYWFAQFNLI